MKFLAVVVCAFELLASPVSAAEVGAALIMSTLHVSGDHLRVKDSGGHLDVYYRQCGSWDGPAMRKRFQADLIRLLPVLLANAPNMHFAHIHGGCEYSDPKKPDTTTHFDEDAISASFTREAIAATEFSTVDPEYLFNTTSFGRWMNPDMR